MNQSPLISIIIPNYNHANFLEQRIASVLEQTVQDFEVILLDDASADKSCEILCSYEKHPKVAQVVLNRQNSGSPFRQWQKGISLAKGEYIWIAESDDYCAPNFLERVLLFFDRNTSAGIVYSQSVDVDENGKELLHRSRYTKRFTPNIWTANFLMEGTKFVKDYFIELNVIPNASAVVFKKNLVNKKMFTPNLLEMKMCGDWLFWIKLTINTNIGFIAEDLNFFRNHAGVSRKHVSVERKKLRLIEESLVRSFLQTVNIKGKTQEFKLYRKWFKLCRRKAVLSKQFYTIKLKETSIFSFLFQVFKYYSKN